VAKWFDPAAFTAPLSTTNSSGTITGGAVGNLGRDTLVGPGLEEVDLALLKNTRFGERLNTQFRAEFFNALNHSNFTTPNPIVFSALNTAASSTAGVITATATSSRQIQFGLKVSF
jgi:hypothetical protein